MKIYFLKIFYVIFVFTFIKGFAYQEKGVSNSDKEFILRSKNHDSIENFLLKIVSSHPQIAEEAYTTYLQRGTKENNNRILFNSHYYLANIAYNNGDYINAINHSKIASEIAETKKDDELKLSSYTLNGNSFFAIRYYDNASLQYQKSYKIAQKLGNKENEIASQININNCWIRINRFREALQSFEKINKKLTQKVYRGRLYYSNFLSAQIGEGVCHYKLGNYDQAISIYKIALETAKKLQIPETIAIFHNTIGETYIAKEKFNLAIHHLDSAKTIALKNDKVLNQNLYTTNYHLASLFFQQQKFQQSFDILKESFTTINSEEIEKRIEKIDEMYELARQCAEKLNNSKNELFYSNAYHRIIDFRHQDDINTRDQLYNYDLLELEEEKEILKSKNNLYIISLVIILIILLLFFLYHFQRQKKNKILFDQFYKNTKIVKTNDKEITKKKEFITDQKAYDLFHKLKKLEKTLFFLQEDCSLHNTAKMIDTNTTYLSKMMNTYRERTFSEYINELRIKYCCEKLTNDSRFRSYTIKAIAGELGYKSVNTFGTAFKKHTGLSHSYFIKQILATSSKKHEQVVY